jgi:hypothetical protein
VVDTREYRDLERKKEEEKKKKKKRENPVAGRLVSNTE